MGEIDNQMESVSITRMADGNRRKLQNHVST